MMNNPYAQYKRMSIETASQGQLILMLYEGAIKNLRMAQNAITRKNVVEAHKHLIKAQDIIKELNYTLNMDAGEIAQNLRDLYVYMLDRLVEANIKKDSAMVGLVIDLMSKLKEGWDGIILKKNAASGTMP